MAMDGHPIIGENPIPGEPGLIPLNKWRPLVSCSGCGNRWFGRTAAHGLAIIGHCPRCGGNLAFSEPVEPDAHESEPDSEQAPSQVLGAPRGWDS